MARRYSKEFKERAVRLTAERQQVHSCKRWPAAEAVALKLGISPHTLMDWIRQDATRAKMVMIPPSITRKKTLVYALKILSFAG